MSMRSQVYAWNGANNNPALANNAATAYGTFNNLSGTQISIFIGGFGNNITKPAETTATEFVVIEDISCTPSLNANAGVATNNIAGITAATPNPNALGNAAANLATGQLATWQLTNNLAAGGAYTGCSAGVFGPRMYVQVRINTTDYFQNPDVTQMNGVPGLASPYPRGSPSGFATAATVTTYNPDNLLKSFDLYPDVYVLPGQVFQILYTTVQGAPTQVVQAFVKYTLYDGPDALIANKLLELGVTINPNNVDWYKRSLIEQQTRSAVAATAAAAGGQA